MYQTLFFSLSSKGNKEAKKKITPDLRLGNDQPIDYDRAENNGRSADNFRPDRGLDQSNSHLAGHLDRSFLDTNILISIPNSCRLTLYNAVMIYFSLAFFAALH